jgi:hypothetical protein
MHLDYKKVIGIGGDTAVKGEGPQTTLMVSEQLSSSTATTMRVLASRAPVRPTFHELRAGCRRAQYAISEWLFIGRFRSRLGGEI